MGEALRIRACKHWNGPLEACDPKMCQSSLASVATALERGDWSDMEYHCNLDCKTADAGSIGREHRTFHETVHHRRGVEECDTRRNFADIYLSMSATNKIQAVVLLLHSCVNQVKDISRISRTPSQSVSAGSLALAHPITILQA